MTYDKLEQGEHLTIHNATKEQLKWMVKDREDKIKHLWEELEEEKKARQKLYDIMVSDEFFEAMAKARGR